MNNDAKVHISRFIDDAKAMLDTKIQARRNAGLTVDIDWASINWSLKNVAPDKNSDNKLLSLSFSKFEMVKVKEKFKLSTHKKLVEPLLPWLGEFAKAVCAHYLCMQGKSWSRITNYLHCLRWLDLVLRDHQVEGLHELLPHHLAKINSLMDRTNYVAETKFRTGDDLAALVGLMNKYGLTGQRLSYVNPYDRNGSKKGDHTVEEDSMHILYECINNPLDDDERIMMEFLRLHVASGNRVGETQTTPADSYFNGNGTTLMVLEREKQTKECNHGLAYFREKAHGGLEIRPLDIRAYESAKIAVDSLNRLCAPARERAKLLADMPGRFPLPKNADGTEFYEPGEFITRSQIAELLGQTDGGQWLKTRNVPNYTVAEARAKGWNGKAARRLTHVHMVADVERACLSEIELVVLRHRDGTPKLWLHDLLCVVFQNQLRFTSKSEHKTRPLFPESITQGKVHAELASGEETRHKHPSLFDRRGLKLPDGSPIWIRSHQTRHTRNKFLDEAGLSQIQQAHAMGRDPTQNEWYQGGSDINIIQHSHLARLRKAEHSTRTAIVKDGVRERLIEGSITEAYHRLRDLDVVKAEEFLDEQVGQVLVTRFGACTNEWSGQSCPKHNKCFKRCKSYHVTGVESEKIELEKELSIQRLHLAKVKELADENVYGADTALHNLNTEIASIEEALAQWQRAADRRKEMERKVGTLGGIPVNVQVYPDGVNHYKEIKRSDGSAKAKGV